MLGLLRRLLSPAPRESDGDRQWREATERWIAINAAKRAAGCPCGSPATKVQRLGGTVGSVPAEVWTCDEHAGVIGWSGDRPLWCRPVPCHGCQVEVDCGGWSGPIGKPPTRWHCPVRPEPLPRAEVIPSGGVKGRMFAEKACLDCENEWGMHHRCPNQGGRYVCC